MHECSVPEKRHTDILSRRTHLVELDRLRGCIRLPVIGALPPGDYFCIISRARLPRLPKNAMTLKTTFETLDSFNAADDATRREYWMMTMEQRLTILEQLRMQVYPDGQTAPDFKEFLSLLRTHRVEYLENRRPSSVRSALSSPVFRGAFIRPEGGCGDRSE